MKRYKITFQNDGTVLTVSEDKLNQFTDWPESIKFMVNCLAIGGIMELDEFNQTVERTQ